MSQRWVVRGEVSQLAAFLEKDGEFESSWKKATMMPSFLRRSKLLTAPNNDSFTASIVSGKFDVLVTAQAAEVGTVELVMEHRGAKAGIVVGVLFIPICGIGFLLLLRVWARSVGIARMCRNDVIPIITTRFPLVEESG